MTSLRDRLPDGSAGGTARAGLHRRPDDLRLSARGRVGDGVGQPHRALGHAHRLGSGWRRRLPRSDGGPGQAQRMARQAYMAAIRPFRHLLVYPALMRRIERGWRADATLACAGMTLPPGQRAVDGFPRFGTHLHRPPPAVPAEPVIGSPAPSPTRRRPAGRARHAAAARADRRLPLRRRVVRHRPALGGRRVRDLPPQVHRARDPCRARSRTSASRASTATAR